MGDDDAETDPWVTGFDIHTGRSGVYKSIEDGKIYVFSSLPDLSGLDLFVVEIYKP